jgi:hypothetical protein
MTFDSKMNRIWVDAGLVLGLIVAVGAVYSVETRMPRPAANRVTADHAKMVETHESQSPGDEANKAKADLAGNVATQQTPLPRPQANKAKEDLVGNVATQKTPLPPPEANTLEDGSKQKVEIAKNLTGLATRPAPKDPQPNLGTYVYRTRKDKSQWIGQYGGSQESEASVQAGLNWLVRHQATDGFWSSECLALEQVTTVGKCEKQGRCTAPGMNYMMAQTGLALLALQASGNYECNEEVYSEHVRRGLNWLEHHQKRDGALVGPLSGHPGAYGHNFMYEHAIATFALAEACAVRRAQGKEDAPRLRQAADKAIAFIERQQHNDGGWRYTNFANERSDASVSGWAMLALKSAREAGIPVHRKTLDRTRYFFQSCETSDGRTTYQPGIETGSDAMTAVGMLTHLMLLKDPTVPLVGTSATHLARQAEMYQNQLRAGHAEFYTLYNATLAMNQAGGEYWNRWNDAVRDGVVALQIHGQGCERGSWDPSDMYGSQGGRIYSTALATLTLEVYYRFARDDGATVLAPRK